MRICDTVHQETRLSSGQFDAYLAAFLRHEATEAVSCDSFITESEIWEVLKLVGREKTFDELPYELYFRQSPVFVPC